ncbi:hypothetical protein CNMCM7691_002467 [Aspergillus felis]|uniref:Uncharacterized protein n=1 Tax=Aspergillus felis TaxID=1287682 RepID=A0A8H6QYZ2_9EURO|nr:hypothetical protein CNMCM7691_002467 [Aspergillus felis]
MSHATWQSYWPGGIPATIRLHPTKLCPSDLQEETKGWLQFVREEWRPASNVEDEVRQRRLLVEKWAAANQDFRDSYQLRASSPSSGLDYPASALAGEPQPDKRFVCLAPVDRQRNPRNYVRLLKFLILLYIHQDEWNGVHPFDRLDTAGVRTLGYVE